MASADLGPDAAPGEITRRLESARSGEAGASERRFALVDDDPRATRALLHVRLACG